MAGNAWAIDEKSDQLPPCPLLSNAGEGVAANEGQWGAYGKTEISLVGIHVSADFMAMEGHPCLQAQGVPGAQPAWRQTVGTPCEEECVP